MVTEAALPLDDLVVVELGESIATAYAGKLLADFGASVIRVDSTTDGDLYRSAPLIGKDEHGLPVGAAYLYLNRGKQSVAIDLATGPGRDVVSRLISRSDVLIDGLGAGRLASFGLEYDDLLKQHDDLLIAAITPFGLTGPYRDLPASDLTILALGGLLNMVGSPDRKPLKLGGSQAQYAAGLSTYTGIMAALYHRDRAEEGQLIDISMLESVAFMEWKSAAYYESDGNLRSRVGDNSQWQVLPARDGYIALVYQDASWPALKKLVGDPALDDPAFTSRPSRRENAGRLRSILGPWFASKSKQEIYHQGQAVGIPLGFVATAEDILESEQYAQRGFWESVDHPAHGLVRYPGIPYQAEGLSASPRRAPMPGEDTREVLRSVAEYSEEEITQLRLHSAV